jgi:hypothetical protein
MCFNRDTVLGGTHCCIQAGSFDMVGVYIMPYYVTELRIMYSSNYDNNSVYERHPPIFENICGVVPAQMHVSRKEIVCIHGNIAFKASNAIFKGVRDVHEIKVHAHPISPCFKNRVKVCFTQGVVKKLLHSQDPNLTLELTAHVNMAVVTGCIGKSSLVSKIDIWWSL